MPARYVPNRACVDKTKPPNNMFTFGMVDVVFLLGVFCNTPFPNLNGKSVP